MNDTIVFRVFPTNALNILEEGVVSQKVGLTLHDSHGKVIPIIESFWCYHQVSLVCFLLAGDTTPPIRPIDASSRHWI